MKTVRSRQAGLGVLLLATGGALAYAALQRRWGYYSGAPFTPSDLSHMPPADRAALTVWWWDSMNTFCGPFPAIWPALALLPALPSALAAIRGRTANFRWGTISMVFALCGAATVVAAMGEFVLRSQASDNGWVYAVDRGTFAIAEGGYALLFVGAWLVRRVNSANASRAASA